jgi:hypothetical protein
MKKSTSNLCCLILLITLLFAACRASDSNSPSAVLTSFFELLSRKDVDGAARLTTEDGQYAIAMIRKGIEWSGKLRDPESAADSTKPFSNLKIGEAVIEGNTASVPVSLKSEKKVLTHFKLFKTAENWKVALTMENLAALGQRKLKNDAELIMDSTHNLNPQDIQHSMELADSILRNMDPGKVDEIQKNLEKHKSE